MNELFIELKQTIVYGKSAGDSGNPLVLGIHGWSQRNGWHTWEPLMYPLAEAGYYVVSVDMPGWGKSPALDGGPLVGQQAIAVIIGIIDGLEKSTAVLMGKSWGGGVAVNTALDFPNRVSQLILTAPALRAGQRLESLRQPVLLAWAEDDPVIPIGNAQQFVAAAQDVQLVTYPTGGHSAAPNNASNFSKKAVIFLASHEI